MKTIIALDSAELATVLAALRFWQAAGEMGMNARQDAIATNGGILEPLDLGAIDTLCERINLGPDSVANPYLALLTDAAGVIGGLCVGSRDKVAVLSGSHVEIEQPPEGLFGGKGEPNEDGEFDEFEFDAVANPDVVAY